MIDEMDKELISEIKSDEGFRSKPYKCSEGALTIGYGTKLPLSQKEQFLLGFFKGTLIEEEAEVLLKHRLKMVIDELNLKLPWLKDKPRVVKNVLYNMSYQMGVNGVMKFKKTLEYIKNSEYEKASDEMLNSLWAKQTPNRAKRLSKKICDVRI